MSKGGFEVDVVKFNASLEGSLLSGRELLQVEGAGARVIINKQRELVPVDTAATKNSCNSHVIEANETRVVDEVGPETDYAPFIEKGVPSKPNYPIQPFVVPSVVGNEPAILNAISANYKSVLEAKWRK